ncbi:MAG: DUF2970 domain-containing protein [Gammaproteobacteria bacterium]|nr:DUF2970 domain-containing protein [Gammaproteobacteria bacterium]MCB1924185.1 DUF2970 domain-containing protein [Gammaproteobacteria bacterium]
MAPAEVRSGSTSVTEQEQKLPFHQVLASVLASFIGVQKNATRERDFSRGRPRDFILVGILMTVIFVLAVWGVVKLVMGLAAGH